MSIAFTDVSYTTPAEQQMKRRLEALFNRDDVQQKLEAVARHIFPDFEKSVKPAHGYPMATLGLTVFGLTPETDGDPHNLCGAVLHAAVAARNERESKIGTLQDTKNFMSQAAYEGLKTVTKEMLAIVENDPNVSQLQNDILSIAKKTKLITTSKGVA